MVIYWGPRENIQAFFSRQESSLCGDRAGVLDSQSVMWIRIGVSLIAKSTLPALFPCMADRFLEVVTIPPLEICELELYLHFIKRSSSEQAIDKQGVQNAHKDSLSLLVSRRVTTLMVSGREDGH